MKNYKHSFKTNNKMKLATVAASAIMLAPVAMSTVSTFADGGYAATDSQGVGRMTYFPVYSVVSLSAGVQAANNQNGTNGTADSGSQEGATVGFSTADLDQAIADLNAISTSKDTPTGNSYYTSALFDQVVKAEGDAFQAATKINDKFQDASPASGNPLIELNTANQQQYDYRSTIGQKYDGLKADGRKLHTDAQTANDAAVASAKAAALPNATDTQKAQALADASAANAAIAAFQKSAANYVAFKNAVEEVNNVIARKTDNGAVTQAAATTAAAIANVPAGTQKDELTKEFLTAQGIYRSATITNVVKTAGDAASKAIDAAAAKAVKDLNTVAGKAFALAPATTTSANGQAGTITVNYPKGYGIQIWTAEGKIVRYNSKEAKQRTDAGIPTKLGDAKKLDGGKSFKVYNVNGAAKTTMNGTTYYNLGGDQYIDVNYTKNFTPVK